MDPNVMTFFDAINLVGSIASLVLAVVAIWLSISFKQEADKINSKTIELLTQIQADVNKVTQDVMSEMKLYNNTMRGALFSDAAARSPGKVFAASSSAAD